MQRNITYFFIFLLLSLAVYYFLVYKNNTNPYGDSEAKFSIKDTASIGKIFLVTTDGTSILVERTDSGWVVNKQFKALKSTLRLVMNTIYQQEVLYPVTKNAFNFTIKNLATSSIKVEIYDKKGGVISKFYVGGEAPNNSGTIMMMDGAKKPYIVQIPGFVGYLTSRFSCNIMDWRDRTVFDIPVEEIKSINVNYNDKKENSFFMNKEQEHISVTNQEHLEVKETLNLRNCNLYLSYFTNINCEGFLNGTSGLDSVIKNTKQQSTIDIIGIHGQHQHAEIYWMPINKRSKNITVSDNLIPDQYDSDRLFAIINGNKDTVLIQTYVFKKIFRQYAEFYQEPSKLIKQ